MDGLVEANEVCRLIDLMLARHIGHVSSCFAQTPQKPRCKQGWKYFDIQYKILFKASSQNKTIVRIKDNVYLNKRYRNVAVLYI